MKYALSPNKLHGDIKMRCYAIELAQRYLKEYGVKPQKPVTMQLNYFLKDPLKPKVSKRQVNITIDELEGEWDRIVEDALEMQSYAHSYRKLLDFEDKPDYTDFDHEEIPGPESSNACNAYGGCPYQSICSGRESVQRYFTRVDNILNPKVTVKEKKMASIFQEMIAKKRAEKKGETTPFKQTEPVIDENNVEPAPPPWAEPKCKSCKGTGLDKNGAACPICFKLAKAAGKPLPTQCTYMEETNEWAIEAEITNIEPESADDIPVLGADGTMKAPKKTLAASRKANPLADAAAKKKAKDKKDEKVKEEAEPGKPKADKKAKSSKRGRPALGYTLCVGTVPLRTGTREIIYATELLDKLKKMISDELGEAYEEQDAFKRRDMLVIGLNSIVEDFGAAWIITPSLQYATQDMRALVEALRVHAQTEIVAVA
jgi:hypothetical protein